MKNQTQNKRLLAYLKKHRRGITTMEAFQHLKITCLHKRISELENTEIGVSKEKYPIFPVITRWPEKTEDGARIIRYSLGR